jgi:beta-glucosidase/6-phospho-beta-glucosidase/beta-galactosidase
LSVIIAKREVMKNLGWFTDPLFFGKYPKELDGLVPEFTLSEKILLRNSIDFFGLNHYTSYLINNKGEITVDPNWVQATSTWLYDVPFGIYNILAFIKDRYGDIPIYITESGFSMKNDTINDTDRINYLNNYILETLKCIDEKKVNVKGFFVWSLLDNFEWSSGYNETFGIVYVNRTDYSRIPKNSALMLRDYIN